MQNATQTAPMEAVTSTGVLALIGDFDLFRSEELEAQISAGASNGAQLCLDFTKCSYVDSSILTVLVRAVRSYGDQLQMIVPPEGNVARILSITQLDHLLPIVS